MSSAREDFVGGAVATVVPLQVEDIDAKVGSAVPLCAVAELKAPAVALELKMRRDDRNEVFQQWELPEDEPEEEVLLLNKLQRAVSGGQIKGFDQELSIPFVFPFYCHAPPAFDLDEESTLQPSRHADVWTAAQLEWSANILSIKVVDSTVGYPVNVYGSVFVRDDLDRHRVYLFRRDRNNSQLVKSSEEALILTGPSRGLLVFDNLFFEFDLKMRCNQDDIDFSQGKMHYCNHSAVRTRLIINKIKTKVSTIEIAYAAVKRAVEATIQINVPKDISLEFGRISALITGIDEEVILFDSDTSGPIKIKDDGIELCRSIVSVPIDGSLLLRVDTWEGDYKAKLSGSATIFTPHLCGEYVATVHSAMQVKVTWSPVYISKFDDKLLRGMIFDF